jgi:ribosomal protein S18 acetylase RimI-like enzyme
MRDEPVLRTAIPGDAPTIVRLIRSSFDAGFVELTAYGAAGIELLVADQIEAMPAGGDSVWAVAEAAGRVVACVEMRVALQSVMLNYIAVEPEQRGRGVGADLLLFALDRCQPEARPLFMLDVLEHNAGPLNWYRRLGFEETACTAWLLADITDSAEAARFVVMRLPPGRKLHEIYGVGSFAVATDEAQYEVGLLGRNLFRVFAASALSDGHLAAALRGIDGTRRLLAVLPGDDVERLGRSNASLVTRASRMSAGTLTVRERLRESIDRVANDH